MSKRIDKSWLVFISIENFEHNRCVDLFSRLDGSCGFEEFRRDAEDRGDWTPVQYYSGSVYASREAALAAAIRRVVAGRDPPKPLRTKIAARASRLISTLTVARASERKRDVASWPRPLPRDSNTSGLLEPDRGPSNSYYRGARTSSTRDCRGRLSRRAPDGDSFTAVMCVMGPV